MNTIQQNQITLSILKDRLNEAKQVLEDFEIDADDKGVVEQFEDLIDSDGPVKICGLGYTRSTIMRTVDPIHYRQELLFFIDNLDINDYNEPLREAVEIIEYDIEALKADMEEAK